MIPAIRPGKLPLFLMRKEEHYPHSMANAVVAEAKRRGLTHEEYHSQVQYVVAHGISSMVEEKKVIIGSAHFVFEDEGCRPRIPICTFALMESWRQSSASTILCAGRHGIR